MTSEPTASPSQRRAATASNVVPVERHPSLPFVISVDIEIH